MIHGTIQINYHTICEYEITNGEVNTPEGYNMYNFHVEGTEKNGKPYEFEWTEFVLPTTAPMLVSLCMIETHRRLIN